MNSGFYAACAGLIARMQSLDVVAHNLANSSTPAYKAEQPTFRSLLAGSAGSSEIESAVNDFGVLGGSHLDRSGGNLERTGNDLDLALEGGGFFIVQTSAGLRYTRNGRLQLSSDRRLVTSSGDPLLNNQGTPLQLPPGTIAIAPDGSVSVDGALVGRLKVVEFGPDASLEALGSGYFRTDAVSGPALTTEVRQGVIEASNVDPVSAAVSLVTVQRYAELLQRALSIFHSDFNRVASEDLPKV